MSKVLRSKLIRYLTGGFLLLAILAVVVTIRVQTSLPYLDRMRFGHWMWQDEWNALADALRSRSDVVELYCLFDDDDCEVRGSRLTDGSREDIEITDPERTHIHALMRSGHIYSLERADTHVYVPLRAVDRLGRSFAPSLVSPHSEYEHSPPCDGQFNRQYEGRCEVELGDTWLITYFWRLTIERQWARCFGIWGEFGELPPTTAGIQMGKIGNELELESAVEELGRDQATRFAEEGAADYRNAMAEGGTALAEEIVAECDYSL